MNQTQNMRAADVAVAHSETKLTGFRLISQGQVKVWKFMLFSLFFSGFVGALALTVGLDIGSRSEAASSSPVRSTGLASGPDLQVQNFNTSGVGTVSVPYTLSASVVSTGGLSGTTSFYFVKEFPGQGVFQLPGCAWENFTIGANQSMVFSCEWIPEKATNETVTAWLLPVPGEFTISNNFVQSQISISPFVGATYFETFEQYGNFADPAKWVDTKAYYSLGTDDELFKTVPLGGSMVFSQVNPGRQIHTHYSDTAAQSWSNYTVTGRIFFPKSATNAAGGITLYSKFPQQAKYYTIKAAPGFLNFSPAGLGTGNIKGDLFDIGPVYDTWYRFKAQINDEPSSSTTGASKTRIFFKAWQEGSQEPQVWGIDAYDDSSSRLTSGTVGVYAYSDSGIGVKVDQLMVVMNSTPPPPPTNLAPQSTITDSSSCYPTECWIDNIHDQDISGWDGTVTADHNGNTYVTLQLPGGVMRTLTEVKLLTDTGVGYNSRWAKDFRIQTSTDGSTFSTALTAVKAKTSGFESYTLPANTKATHVKLIIDSNYGDSNYIQVGELEVWGY